MDEANADVKDDSAGELQNRRPGDCDRRTGPLDLVFEDEVTIRAKKKKPRVFFTLQEIGRAHV